MPRCETCGNDYDRAMDVVIDGRRHVFDCFECAIHALAPSCAHCGCRIIGHGLQVSSFYYCCTHCLREDGVAAGDDRAKSSRAS